MQKNRQLQVNSQRQMFFQHFLLLGAGRKVAVEVQPAFTHRTHARFLEQGKQLAGAVAVPVTGRVRVNAGRREQPLAAFVQLAAQLQGLFAAFDAGAGQHQLAHPGRVGTVQHGLVFAVKAWVGQVDADINELHGFTSGHRPRSISEL